MPETQRKEETLRFKQVKFLMLPASIWRVWGKWSTPAELCIIAAVHTLNTLKIKPRNKDIAELVGCSEHTVKTALHKLEHFNFNRMGQGNPHTREIEVLIPPGDEKHFFKLPALHGSPLDKLLKGIIGALSQPTGWCTAGDAYFAEHGIAKDTLHRWIRATKSSGCLVAHTYYDNMDCQWHRRMKFSTDILSTTLHAHPEGLGIKSYSYTAGNRTHTSTKIVQDREFIEINRELATPSVAHPVIHTQPQRAGSGSDVVMVENHFLETAKKLKDAGTLAILPARNIAQERGLLAKRIKEYGVDAVKEVINAAASDEWCKGKGFTLSMILAANEFNILANGGAQAKSGARKPHTNGAGYTYHPETPEQRKAKTLAIQQRVKDIESQPICRAAQGTAKVVSSLGLFKEHFALDVANLEVAAETKPIDFEAERRRQKEQVEIWLQAHPEQRDGVHIAEHCHTARVAEQTDSTPCQTPMRVSSGYLKDQIEQLKALYGEDVSPGVLESAIAF